MRKRPFKERVEYRENILKKFFRNSFLHQVEMRESNLKKRILVGLLDERQRTVSLGIIKKLKER